MKPATVCMEANYSRDRDDSSRRNNRYIMNVNSNRTGRSLPILKKYV
jgi:hypothetical protein